MRAAIRIELQQAIAGVGGRTSSLQDQAGRGPSGLRTRRQDGNRGLEQRLSALETRLREVETQAAGTSEDRDRKPAVLLGGWATDMPAAQVKDLATKMARTLQLDMNMTPGFGPKGFGLVESFWLTTKRSPEKGRAATSSAALAPPPVVVSPGPGKRRRR